MASRLRQHHACPTQKSVLGDRLKCSVKAAGGAIGPTRSLLYRGVPAKTPEFIAGMKPVLNLDMVQ